MIETGDGIDWAVGVALAFATLIVEGIIWLGYREGYIQLLPFWRPWPEETGKWYCRLIILSWTKMSFLLCCTVFFFYCLLYIWYPHCWVDMESGSMGLWVSPTVTGFGKFYKFKLDTPWWLKFLKHQFMLVRAYAWDIVSDNYRSHLSGNQLNAYRILCLGHNFRELQKNAGYSVVFLLTITILLRVF